ncbi:substrate-binding domain-containing protein [Solimonas sp. K1W22B-7]|uniref:substrate-binding domain-containing protein n=1 Tax=Solimonas sp. K1W22B-7 TaxID=2303331 RepID=UPI0013C4B69D|nr:substrate-binding domain-containing protein [Solimonas sp. K1W22B-7]
MKLNTSFCVVAIAAALSAQAAVAATPVPPTTVLYGGGATFPSEAYVGPSFLKTLGNPRRLSQTLGVTAPANVSVNPAALTDKTALFGAFAVVNPTIGVSYCQTGSGVGKGALSGARNATADCGDYGVAAPVGFAGPTIDADFAGSDEPVAQSDITAFNANAVGSDPAAPRSATKTSLVQIPAVAGSIAFVYNNPSLGKKKLNLTRSDVCGIFAGTITDWSQLTHTPKVTIAAKPIKVVYRSDSSGTTFSLANFLSQACPSLTLPDDTAQPANKFQMNKVFTAVVTGGVPGGSIPASGNGGIVSTVAINDGAIGYADIADGLARAKIAGGLITYATVSYAADLAKEALVIAPEASGVCPAGTFGKIKDANDGKAAGPGNPVGGTTLEPITTVLNPSTTKSLKFTCPAVTYNKLDPAKNLVPKGFTAIKLTTQAAKVLGTVNAATGRQPLADITVGTLPAGVTSCIQTVDPADYAQPLPAATKKAAADFDRYPVIAVSYLMGYTNGYGAKLAAIKSLLKAPFDAAVLGKTKTIGKAAGFQPLDLVSAASTTPVFVANSAAAIVDACVAN